MIKILLLPFLFMLPFFAQSQTLIADSINNRVKYEVMVDQAGTKDHLYAKGKNWVSQTFKNNASVVDLADSVSGNIFINASTETTYEVEDPRAKPSGIRNLPVTVFFECRMYFRDNKYRVVIDNLRTKPKIRPGMQISKDVLEASSRNTSISDKEAKSHVNAGENAIKKILASLNSAVSTP